MCPQEYNNLHYNCEWPQMPWLNGDRWHSWMVTAMKIIQIADCIVSFLLSLCRTQPDCDKNPVQLAQKIMATPKTMSLFDPRTKGMSKALTLCLQQMLAEQTTVFFSCVWRYLFANHCRHPPPVGRPHNTLTVWRSSTPSNIGALSTLSTFKGAQ